MHKKGERMEYMKGDRVKHPTKDDWGLGEVLENSNGESVRVFFVALLDFSGIRKSFKNNNLAPD